MTSRAGGDEAAGAPAQRLAQGRGQDVDLALDAAMLRRAAATLADEAGGMGIIHHHQGVMLAGKIDDRSQRRDIAIHAEDAVGGDEARAGILRLPSAGPRRSSISAWR